MATFAERFCQALINADITAAELSRKLNIPEGTISQYKSGAYEPKQRRLEQISKALDVSVAWLMGVSDTPYPELPSNATPVTGMVPILGTIRAGEPVFAEQNIEGYLPTNHPHPEDYFVLRVKGDSMIGAGIVDGSRVFIHIQDYAEDGQIVACGVNGSEATLKRFKTTDSDTIFLMPENSKYTPIVVSKSDFSNGSARIYGVAVEVTNRL